ncbi:MAG: YkvA family protein [Faecousia sp.]
MSLKSRAEQLKTDIPALWLCLKAKETPVLAKVLAAAAVGYALSPIDLIPDFIPVLGYLDDLIILPTLVALTLKCIPKEIFERYRTESAGMWENGKPKKWYYALPIVAVWALVFFLVLKALL